MARKVKVRLEEMNLYKEKLVITKFLRATVEKVLNHESLLMISCLGRFNLLILTGFLDLSAIANCCLHLLDCRISFLACSNIPHFEIIGLIYIQFL